MDLPPPQQMFERVLTLPVVAAVVQRLPTDLPSRVYLVGGAVRDLLVGAPVVDIDLAVEGPLDGVLACLGGDGGPRAHGRFGTATVRVGEAQVDLAATRRESYSGPGELPDVEPASIEEDLGRRDFTVNAMALALTGREAGSILSVPRALQDLEGRRMRVLHDRSFEDDPTRLIRLVRYSSRLGFEVEPRTMDLVRAAVREGAIGTVSGPRIGNELRLLAAEADPVTPWEPLREWGIDQAIAAGFGMPDRGRAARALGLLPADGSPEVVVLALAVSEMARRDRAALLDRLGFPARLRDAILRVADRSGGLAERLSGLDRPSEIAAVVEERHQGVGTPELVAVAGALGPEEPARLWLEQLRHIHVEIDGRDLQAEGIPQGPAIGAGLAAARGAALDGHARTRRDQLDVALRAARGTG